VKGAGEVRKPSAQGAVLTRAKKLVVLAGSRRALAAAVRTKGAGRRHTALARRLHERAR